MTYLSYEGTANTTVRHQLVDTDAARTRRSPQASAERRQRERRAAAGGVLICSVDPHGGGLARPARGRLSAAPS
jgi:hypothetical protein